MIDRQPLYGTLNRHNLKYIRAKVSPGQVIGLGEMLSGTRAVVRSPQVSRSSGNALASRITSASASP